MSEKFFAGLIRNVSAGTRLAFLLPVRWQQFRASVGQFVLLAGFNFLVWGLSNTLQAGGGVFNPISLAIYLAQIPLLLLACIAIASIHGNSALAILLAVVLSASDLAFELAGVAVFGAGTSPSVQILGWVGFLVWGWLIAVRGIVVCMHFQWRSTTASAGVIAILMAFYLLVLPRADLWTQEPVPEPSELVQESVFHAQGELIERGLAALETGREGEAELYFVGFAPDGSQDVFRHEMGAVKEIFDRQYGSGPRSIVLLSNPATLGEYPIATATNLRRALKQVGARMNPDEDVLFLYITAHGDARFQLSAYAPPLALAPVNPTLLARALNDAGIKWRVLVVSACYSGGFIEPLKDENTLIITASAPDRQSFGCENGNQWTYFGEAYFKQALGRTRSFVDAFPFAAQAVAQREAAEKLSPASNPQMFAGRAIVEKLKQLSERPGS